MFCSYNIQSFQILFSALSFFLLFLKSRVMAWYGCREKWIHRVCWREIMTLKLTLERQILSKPIFSNQSTTHFLNREKGASQVHQTHLLFFVSLLFSKPLTHGNIWGDAECLIALLSAVSESQYGPWQTEPTSF